MFGGSLRKQEELAEQSREALVTLNEMVGSLIDYISELEELIAKDRDKDGRER